MLFVDRKPTIDRAERLYKPQEFSRITNRNLKSKEDINTNNSFGFLSQAEIVETEKETYNPKDGEPGRVTLLLKSTLRSALLIG